MVDSHALMNYAKAASCPKDICNGEALFSCISTNLGQCSPFPLTQEHVGHMPNHFCFDLLQSLPPPFSLLLFSMSCEANPPGWLIWIPSLHGYLSTGVNQEVAPWGELIFWWFTCCPLLNSAIWQTHISPTTLSTHGGFRNTIFLLSFRLWKW